MGFPVSGASTPFSHGSTFRIGSFFTRNAPRILLGFCTGILLLGLCYPLVLLGKKSLYDKQDIFIGLANFTEYFQTPGLAAALEHTLLLGVLATLLTLVLAFLVAYGLTHTAFFGRRICRSISLLPLFAPSIFPALGFIYLMGNQGLIRDFIGEVPLYGPLGILLGSVVFTLPHAILLLTATLRDIDQALYLTARTLGAGAWKRFYTITLPASRYGITSAAIVVFTLTITDFGVPKVLGGDYSMLSTEVFQQVVGLQNFNMGATVSLILMCPAILAFFLDAHARKKQHGQAQTRTTIPEPYPVRDGIFTLLVWGALALPLTVVGIVVWGSFIGFWPYDFSFTLLNYEFKESVYGIQPFFNSLKLAFGTSFVGAVLIFGGAYLVERCQLPSFLTATYRILAILPLTVPGTVLGLAFIIAFNQPTGWIGTLFSGIYGGILFLIFNSIIHFYTVCHFTAAGSLMRLNPHYETVGATLKVNRCSTFFRVILPLQKQPLMDMGFYLFVNALTTISAVVFLYSADAMPASVAILQMFDTGRIAEASAMGTLILATALLARAVQLGLHHAIVRSK